MIRGKMESIEEVRRKGLRVLSRELGPFNFVRFVQQYERGEGDYTRDRTANPESVNAIFERIDSRKKR